MRDLRAFLSECRDTVLRIEEPVSVIEDITALQHALSASGRYPVLVIENPILPDGQTAPMPVVTNTLASRTLNTHVLGLDGAAAFAERSSKSIDPVVVERDIPARQVVLDGDQADLQRLPVLHQHVGDLGHYVTAGHCTTADPDSGVDNTSIQRCCIKGPRRLSFYPYPSSHNALNLRKYWQRGEACPIAIWIGHHPQISMAAQAQLPYPGSHWAAAGGVTGAPIRLAPSITHGKTVPVPADAEIVIEGYCPVDVLEADGPFGEYPGVMGVQTATPVIEVTRITHRKAALYHDIGAGMEDHLVPDNMVMEGRLWSLVQPVAPSLREVAVPFSGRRFHAYLQFENPRPGEVRDALAAALSYKRIRTVVAVDEDIDLQSDSDILWAVATRVQWHRDIMRIDGMTHPNLDPALPAGAATISKLAIDATQPPAMAPGLPKPVTPRLTVGAPALDRARRLITNANLSEWPQQ